MATPMSHPNRKVLLDVGDGPEGILIYTDEDEGTVDWNAHADPLYICVSLWGASVKLGPFTLDSIRKGIVEKLK